MSHHSVKSSYKKLEERLNRFPQGAPPSKALYQILGMLFSEHEAALAAQLPIKSFTAKTAARIWKTKATETRKVLDKLASRALLLDIEHNGEQRYMLPPPMAGFFEFSLMRMRNDIDQKALSELFYQYLNVEEDFIKELFLSTETRLGRVFVQEPVLTNDEAIHILDYERASHMLAESTHIGLGMCYCRHKKQHLGLACAAPMDVCLTLNNAAASLIKHGHVRAIDYAEAMEVLNISYENNLVQCSENVRKKVNFICNCCGCCCEGLVAVRKFGALQPLHTTGYMPEVDPDRCTGCAKCARACPIEAIDMSSSSNAYLTESEDGSAAAKPERRKPLPEVDKNICLGCGVCVRACNSNGMVLKRREQKIITPANSVHRTVLMAIEKDMLHELIFDKQAFANHRAMASILSAILKLPPVKRVLANKQLKSVYLDKLLQRA